MRNTTLVSQDIRAKARDALGSLSTFIVVTISLLIFGFLGLTTAPGITTPPVASAISASSETSVNIQEVLSLRIVEQNPSTGEWDVDTDTIETTTRHGAFGHSTVKVIASTNAPGGYTLNLSDVDNNTSLASTAVLDTIPTLSGDRTLLDLDDSTDQFPENAWGYNWVKDGDTANYVFSPIPASNASSSEKQLERTNSKGIDSYSFTLGVRAAGDLAAATYTDQVLFTLVGNPAPSAPDFFKTTYMDEFNASICNSVATPAASVTNVTDVNGYDYVTGGTIVPSTLVKDRRDGEIYTVRKLADGNCWMTDNLRLGKNGSVVLDSTYSNMTSGRTFTVPAANTDTGFSWENQATYPFVFYRDSNPGAVSATIKPDGVTPDGPSALYNWYTATAGARDATHDTDGYLLGQTSGEAADSVCPKGWQLPVNSAYNDTGSKNYSRLVYLYTEAAAPGHGATGNSYADIAPGSETYNQALINEANIITLLSSPLSFVYSDHYNYGGTLYSRPLGFYWSSSVQSGTYSYRLDFNTNGTYRYLNPQNYDNKGNAFAVRCVLQ